MRNQSRSSAFAVFLLTASAFFPRIGGAEPLIVPAVAVSEEYNDNLFLQPYEKEDDYITRVLPSIRFQYTAPFWDWDAAYAYDYRRYAYHRGVDNSTHTATITNKTRVIREFLFLDVRDEYRRVSLSPARDYTQESLFVNQSDRNHLLLNPYVVFHPAPSATLTIGYTYQNIWFEDPAAVDKIDNIATIEAQEEASARLTLSMKLRHTSDKNRIDSYRKNDLALGPRYEYAEKSFLWIFLGGSRISFEQSDSARQLTWDAGITHRLPSYSLTIETALNYIDDPLWVLRREDRYLATLKSEAELASTPAVTGSPDYRMAAVRDPGERTSWLVSAGVMEYRDVVTRYLEDRTYRAHVTFGHAITRRWKGAYDLTAERFEDKQLDYFSVRYVTDVRLGWQVTERLAFSFNYRFTDSYSPDFYERNYGNSRSIVEAKYVF